MSGRHRAVTVANVVAEYLRRMGSKVKINFIGCMYEGCTPCYPKPNREPTRNHMRPDERGPCGCFLGAKFCKFTEGRSWEEQKDWIRKAEECELEVERAVKALFSDLDEIFM
eukprot:9647812-Karenia_brevis.AAC.1